MNTNTSCKKWMGMLLMVSSVLVCRAQDTNDVFLKRNTSVVTRPWQEYLEQLSEQEEYEDMNWESYEDVLEGYAENPINLNTATRGVLSLLFPK